MEDTIFTQLYLENYARLLRMAYVYVPDHEEAENMVHDVYTTLWEQRDRVFEMENVAGYLAVSLKNRCLDYLKHQAHIADHAEHTVEVYRRSIQNSINTLSFYNPAASYDNAVIHHAVSEAIESLPPRCREIYLLCRKEGLKNADVATRLGISLNTVEAQITIAHKKLRTALRDFLPQSSCK